MDLIERLLAEPQRFEFFQAVRLLLLRLGERGVAPARALERHLRFASSLSLAFPPSQIEALAREDDGAGAPRFRLTPAFMGLLGVHGALPNAYTERLLAWQEALPAAPAREDAQQAARAFLDIFTTRMLGLFYQAWQKYRIEHAVAGPRDSFLPLLLALAGAAPGRAGVPDTALARHAGLLGRRPASAAVLGRVLSSHFGAPVAVEEGVGHWDRLAAAEQSALCGANAALGRAALLGARCWRPDLRVRVRIGPLARGRFEDFLPGAPQARALNTMLGLFAAPLLAYEVVLVLRREDLDGARLGAGGRRLGVDGYLLGAPSQSERADLRYELRPMAPLAPLGRPAPAQRT